jgi:exosome complex exonuclease RRP6
MIHSNDLSNVVVVDRYAREDTHYLLYIYDSMRINLSALPKAPESSDAPLVEVTVYYP